MLPVFMYYGQDTFVEKAAVAAVHTRMYTEIFHLCAAEML